MNNKTMRPLSLGEAARLLAVSPRTVSRLIDRGDLNAVRIGSTLTVTFDGMPDYLRCCFDVDCPRALLTLHDAAAALGCSPDDVRARTAAGDLTSVRVGRLRRWSPIEVERNALLRRQT